MVPEAFLYTMNLILLRINDCYSDSPVKKTPP
jgi:hypothetical protein